MPTISLKNVKLFYEERGKGSTLLFIHGWSMNSTFWKRQFELSKQFRVIAIDLRGHGKSSEARGYTMKAIAKDLEEFIKKLGSGDINLVGWSMGVSIIFEYLSLGHKVKSISLVDGNPKILASSDYESGTPQETFRKLLRELQANPQKFMEGFVPLMFNIIPDKEKLHSMVREVLKTPSTVAYESLKSVSEGDYRNLLPQIRSPTSLLHGKFDKLNSLGASQYMLHNILNSRLVVFENSSHCPHIEEPDKFNRTLAQFIRAHHKRKYSK